jgi:hypothetical protein
VNHNDSTDNDTQQPICEMTYCRLSERISKSPVKMLEALKDAYLFFEKKTGKLFVYILNRTGVFIVNLPGTYEDGFFVRDYKVAGVVNGNLHIYLIIYDEQKSHDEQKSYDEQESYENNKNRVSSAHNQSEEPKEGVVVKKVPRSKSAAGKSLLRQLKYNHYYYVVKLMEFNYHYDKLSSHYVNGMFISILFS